MIVLDASVVLEILLRTPDGVRIENRLFESSESFHAPHLIDCEVAQVLRKYWLSGQVSSERGAEVLEDLYDFPLSRYPHDILLPRIWEPRENTTAYDATYVALAEALGAPLWTRDRKVSRIRGTAVKVILV